MKQPNFSFKNKEGRTIYCWSTSSSFIFSLDRIDVKQGKYKEILKEDEDSLYYTSKKLGLNESQYKSLFNNNIKEKEKKRENMFWNEVPELDVKRRILQEQVMRQVGPSKDTALPKNSQMNHLAYIAGAVDQMEVDCQYGKEKTITEDKSINYLFDPSVSIKKPNDSEFKDIDYNVFTSNNKKNKKPVLTEAKDMKIVLGKTELKSLDNGLYEIRITNLPGQEVFHAKLYQSIMKYLEDNLTPLKNSNDDVAAYEAQTENELAGVPSEEKASEESGVDLGIGGEEGAAEAPMGDTGEPDANSNADILDQATDMSSPTSPQM